MVRVEKTGLHCTARMRKNQDADSSSTHVLLPAVLIEMGGLEKNIRKRLAVLKPSSDEWEGNNSAVEGAIIFHGEKPQRALCMLKRRSSPLL